MRLEDLGHDGPVEPAGLRVLERGSVPLRSRSPPTRAWRRWPSCGPYRRCRSTSAVEAARRARRGRAGQRGGGRSDRRRSPALHEARLQQLARVCPGARRAPRRRRLCGARLARVSGAPRSRSRAAAAGAGPRAVRPPRPGLGIPQPALTRPDLRRITYRKLLIGALVTALRRLCRRRRLRGVDAKRSATQLTLWHNYGTEGKCPRHQQPRQGLREAHPTSSSASSASPPTTTFGAPAVLGDLAHPRPTSRRC